MCDISHLVSCVTFVTCQEFNKNNCMKNKYMRFAFVIAASVSLNSCLYKTPVEEEIPPIVGDVSFKDDVEPIFNTQGCLSCHPNSAGLDLTVGNSYGSIFSNNLVDTDNPDKSIIYVHPKDKHFTTYTSAQANIVLTWIEQGSEDN